MDRIDELGGSVRGIETGYFRDEIARSAYEYQKSIEDGRLVVVGVNKYQSENPRVAAVLKVDPALETAQVERVRALRKRRDSKAVARALADLESAARSDANLVEPVLEAVERYATVGEISDVFRKVWGEYHDHA